MEKIKLFVLGAPGSGKGTVSKLLLEALNSDVRYYNVGGILREQALTDAHIKKVHEEGGLVKSDRVLSIFDDALTQEQYLCDGSPRRPEEASYILDHASWIESPGYLIHLELSEEIARERLLNRGRFDDKDEIINKRFEEYRDTTMQSIRLFNEKNRVITIQAIQTPKIVCSNIIKALELI